MVGTVSRTARVSGVTRNLKEAAGKTPARRTEIAYEAGISGREGYALQSPITILEGVSVYAAGIWGVKVTRITRGDLPSSTGRNPGRGGLGTDRFHVRQKSAEAIRAGLTDRQRAEHVGTNRSLEFRWREQRQKPHMRR